MFTGKKPKKPDRQEDNIETPSNTQIGMVVKNVILNLQANRFEKAADIFLEAQEKGVLPTSRYVVKKLLDILGENTAGRLIDAFAFHPCQFCTKGRTKCEVCKGRGHIEQKVICERCFGLGAARCGFCNGSGWLALVDIPEGIRAVALIKRAEKTLQDAESLLAVQVPRPSKENPVSTLKKCAALWVAMDKLMGVFENIVFTSQSSMVSFLGFDKKLHNIVNSVVLTAAKLEQQIRKVISVMQEAAEMELKIVPSDSKLAKLGKSRAEFYRSLLDKSDLIYNIADAHPLLEKLIKKRLGDKSPDGRNSET
jgi:hypothetical protein